MDNYKKMANLTDRILGFALHPQEALFKVWNKFPVGSFKRRLDFDIFPRPHYAYCTYHAARQAELLGIERISLMEFGVAGGNGLVELEMMATLVEREFKTRIDIYGFDTGTGLTKPEDYRDLPYIWQEGFFEMDEEALNKRLSRSTMVMGDVAETVPKFLDSNAHAPLGAVFMDLDYYSSTRDALAILQGQTHSILPRLYCYFDDVMSNEDGGLMCDRVGQLLSIDEYNHRSEDRYLARINGLSYRRRRPASWNDQVYVHHAFDHPSYSSFIRPTKDQGHLNKNLELK